MKLVVDTVSNIITINGNTNKQGLHDMNNTEQVVLVIIETVSIMACVLSVSIIGALIITTLKAGI